MFVVDTNVLIHAIDRDSQFHAPCRAELEKAMAGRGAWYSTWPIVYEFLRVVTHPRVLARPLRLGEAWSVVAALTASPGFALLVEGSHHGEVAKELFGEMPHLAGSFLHDAHTAVLMREHGIRRILTRDVGFHRFDFLEVVDPVAGPPPRPPR